MRIHRNILLLAAAVSIFSGAAFGQRLVGTSWQLVRFQGSDDTVLTPAEGAKYTVTFARRGRIQAQIHCNQGGGMWKNLGHGRLKLGPLALTLMACPTPGGVDRIARDWSDIVSFVIRDGHLFLALKIDSGIYEFEPLRQISRVTGTVTYRERMALPPTAVIEVTLEDVSRADAAAVVIAEQKITAGGKQVPFSFDLAYDPSTIAANGRYAVRARILNSGHLMFTNTEAYPVITGGKPASADIVVTRTSH